MSRLNKLLAFFIVVVFAATAFLFVRIQNQKKQELATRLAREEKNKITEEELAERKELEEIKKGLDWTLDGEIESVDQKNKSLVLDKDSQGNHDRYSIHYGDGTDIRIVYIDIYPQEQNEGTAGEEEMEMDGARVEEKTMKAGPADLKEGVFARIEFSERMDLKNQEKLEAKKIELVYDKYFEGE